MDVSTFPQRSNGRTPLLEAVQHGRIDVCQFLLERGATVDTNDSYGYTPLWIAVNKGDVDLAKWILTEPRLWTPQWDYDQFRIVVDLMPELVIPMLDFFARPIESKHSRETCVHFTALKQIYGECTVPISDTPVVVIVQNDHARDLIRHPVIMYVLRQKWKTFASNHFRREFAVFIVLLLSFYIPTVAADYRPLNVDSPVDIVLTASRAIAVASALFLLLSVELAECIGATPRKYLSSFWNWVNLVSYVGVLASAAVDAIKDLEPARNGVIAVLHVALWINLLQFLQVSSTSGLLVAMMRHMVKDVYKFLLLYAVFLFGYSGAFYVLLRGSAGYDSFINAFITVFLMLFGALDYSVFSDKNESLSTWSWFVANALLLSHLVAVVVMLLNILIAMMTTTFEDVRDAAKAEALLIRARAIVRIEKSLSRKERERHFLSLIPRQERRLYRTKTEKKKKTSSRPSTAVHPEDEEMDDEVKPSWWTMMLNRLQLRLCFPSRRMRKLQRVLSRMECCKAILDRICYTSVTLEKTPFRPARGAHGSNLAPLEDGVRVEVQVEKSRQTKEDDKDREMQELREQMASLARSMEKLQAKLDGISDPGPIAA
ncbi:hypothetical protein PINS_up016552 [Pythium insidiosum]|nr:hypothetical protein PINS_up016552 [Pythium insidiosum]